MARADMPSLAPAPVPNREAFAKDYLSARRPVCTAARVHPEGRRCRPCR